MTIIILGEPKALVQLIRSLLFTTALLCCGLATPRTASRPVRCGRGRGGRGKATSPEPGRCRCSTSSAGELFAHQDVASGFFIGLYLHVHRCERLDVREGE